LANCAPLWHISCPCRLCNLKIWAPHRRSNSRRSHILDFLICAGKASPRRKILHAGIVATLSALVVIHVVGCGYAFAPPAQATAAKCCGHHSTQRSKSVPWSDANIPGHGHRRHGHQRHVASKRRYGRECVDRNNFRRGAFCRAHNSALHRLRVEISP
jgi:hypothetical protein